MESGIKEETIKLESRSRRREDIEKEIEYESSLFYLDEDKIQIFYRMLVENGEEEIFRRLFGNRRKEAGIANSSLSNLVIGNLVVKKLAELVKVLVRVEALLLSIDDRLRKLEGKK